MDVTLCTSSILHLSCISLDRYYAIVNQPLLYNDRMTKKVFNSNQLSAKVDDFHPAFFIHPILSLNGGTGLTLT